jgi:VWFA-related protein
MVSNARPPSRTYLFALDEVAPDRALRARKFLHRFIEEYLGPNDVGAVALTGRGLSSSGQDFTTNRRLLLGAIDKYTGGFSDADTASPARMGSDGIQLAASLRKLTEFLATMPGRKTMVFVGEGLGDLDVFNLLDYRGTALTPSGVDMHAALATATRNNITIYPVDPRGLTTELAASESFDTSALDNRTDLAALAEATGGFSFTSSNNVKSAFERIVRETSTYYTIGFNSEYDRLDGRFVPVQVRVKRPGLLVKSRAGFVAPREKERRPEKITGDTRSAAVAEALASAIPTNGVKMRVAAAPYRGLKSPSVALAVEIDISTFGLVLKPGTMSADVEVSYLATDGKGKVRPGRRHNATLSLKTDAFNKAIKNGVRMISEFELPQGRYQLRVAAGSQYNAGSVIYDIDVPDFSKDPLMLSGVSLSSTAAAAIPTLKPQDPLKDLLPGPPVATRQFAPDDTLAFFAEVYDNRAPKDAAPFPVTVELRGSDGRVVPVAKGEVTSSSPKGKSGGYPVAGRFPLKNVPEGSYVLRVEAGASGAGSQPVVRGVPIVVKVRTEEDSEIEVRGERR